MSKTIIVLFGNTDRHLINKAILFQTMYGADIAACDFAFMLYPWIPFKFVGICSPQAHRVISEIVPIVDFPRETEWILHSAFKEIPDLNCSSFHTSTDECTDMHIVRECVGRGYDNIILYTEEGRQTRLCKAGAPGSSEAFNNRREDMLAMHPGVTFVSSSKVMSFIP